MSPTPIEPAPQRPNETPAVRPRRANKWLPWAIVAAVLAAGLTLRARQSRNANAPGGGGAGGAGGGRGGRESRLPVVNVVPVTTGNISRSLPLTGSLKSNQNIDLNSKIQGRVARVYVQEGSRVRRGQLLVALDDDDLRAALDSARAALASANSRLQQSQVGLPARVQQVRTGVETAAAQVETAQARYQQALLNEPVARTTSENQVRTARENVRTAQARLEQAQRTARLVNLQTASEVRLTESQVRGAQAARDRALAALAEVRRGARDQQVAQAQAQVNLAEANVRDALTELNRQRILFEGGATARASLDTAQTRYDVNLSQLEVARQNLSLVREGATSEQVNQAQEAVQQAEETIRQAQASVTTARAGRIRVSTEQGNVTAALAALGQAQNGLQTAISNLAQIPITRQETRTALEGVQQAQSALRQARANNSQIPIARSDIAIARAGVQTAQAQVRTAQVNLAYARIYSPVNGVVNQKLTDVGETTGAGTALLNLVSLDRVYFEASVPEIEVNQIRVGQRATVNVVAVSPRPISGFVSDIIPVSDVRLRQFRVRISLPNAPGELTPGAFARGTLVTQEISNALLVPTQAVQSTSTNPQPALFVTVKEDKKTIVKRRTVRVGLVSGDQTQIAGGVRKGDQIVLDAAAISDGVEVRIAKEAGASDDSGSTGGNNSGSSRGGAAGGASASRGGATGGGASGGG